MGLRVKSFSALLTLWLDVSIVEACSARIAVNGAEEVQLRSMGLYTKFLATSSSDNGGRPIWQNAAGQYLYYHASFGEWHIGLSYTDPISPLLRSISDTWCPSDATHWLAKTPGGAWSSSDVQVGEECPVKVVVSVQGLQMGLYTRIIATSNSDNGRRPIWQNAAGQFLYFHASTESWHMGSSYKYATASPYYYSDTWCPNDATDWERYSGGAWSSSDVQVREECPVKIVVSGAESVQGSAMGLYTRFLVTSSGDTGGRPIWQNAAGQYLYYSASSREWQMDSSYTDSLAQLRSRSDTTCPSDATHWLTDWGGARSSSDVQVREACPVKLVVSGAESAQGLQMGLYTMALATSSSDNGGRPIWQNAAGQYLYYHAYFGEWQMDSSYTNSIAQLLSHSDTWCPSDATHWFTYSGGDRTPSSDVQVREATAATLTTTSTPQTTTKSDTTMTMATTRARSTISDADSAPELLLGPAVAVLVCVSVSSLVTAVIGGYMLRMRRQEDMKVFLILEGLDSILDFTAFFFALAEGDLEFTNDGGAVRIILAVSVGLSALMFSVELYFLGYKGVTLSGLSEEKQRICQIGLSCTHLMFEDTFQSMLYIFITASQSASTVGIRASTLVAALQALAFTTAKIVTEVVQPRSE